MSYLIDALYLLRELYLILLAVLTCPLTLVAGLLLIDFNNAFGMYQQAK